MIDTTQEEPLTQVTTPKAPTKPLPDELMHDIQLTNDVVNMGDVQLTLKDRLGASALLYDEAIAYSEANQLGLSVEDIQEAFKLGLQVYTKMNDPEVQQTISIHTGKETRTIQERGGDYRVGAALLDQLCNRKKIAAGKPTVALAMALSAGATAYHFRKGSETELRDWIAGTLFQESLGTKDFQTTRERLLNTIPTQTTGVGLFMQSEHPAIPEVKSYVQELDGTYGSHNWSIPMEIKGTSNVALRDAIHQANVTVIKLGDKLKAADTSPVWIKKYFNSNELKTPPLISTPSGSK